MATYQQSFDPKGANFFSSAIPTIVLANGTNIPVSGVAFNDTTLNAIFIELKALAYLSGNVTVKLNWYGAATTGVVVWGAQLAAVTPGDAQSLLTDALATATTANSTANGTANGDQEVSVVITNLDSLAAGDIVQLRIYRDAAAGGDTFSGNAILVDIEVSYAATGGVGAGDVTGPAGATDNAIARFDATTGKVLQDSAVTVADTSGNIAGAGTYNGVVVDKHAAVAALAALVNPASTTLANITGLSLSLPRAGTYWIEGMLEVGMATSAQLVAFGMNISANFTRMSVGWVHTLTTGTQIIGQQTASLAVGGAGVASGSHTVFTGATTFSGSITVSGAATVQLMASRAANVLTIGAGSAFNIREL